jgi:hypothetical protein
LIKQYDEERNLWSEDKAKIEDKLQSQKERFQEKVPFDPFGVAQHNILNTVKSDF